MEPLMQTDEASQEEQADTQTTASSVEIPLREREGPEEEDQHWPSTNPPPHNTQRGPGSLSEPAEPVSPADEERVSETPPINKKRDYAEYQRLVGLERDDSQASEVSELALEVRMTAFEAMLRNVKTGGYWQRIALLSTDDNHTLEEEELGHNVG